MTIDVDFRQGAVNSFAASGSPRYSSSEGVSFTVSRAGDAPQLQSLFYIMFGRVEMTARAAAGAGIVSSLVLESDDLDELDMEWLGAAAGELQTNYFGKGQTTTYNRGQFHAVAGGDTQARWVRYAVDWTAERVVWTVDGRVVRELGAAQAEPGQYPQTPMRVKVGAWAAGDPGSNAPGTVAWARGPTDFARGPFTMSVRSLLVADYSSGREYRYTDASGRWQSIEAVGGRVNGNLGKNKDGKTSPSPSPGPAEPAIATGVVSVPVGGIARDGSPATATQTGWPWVATASSSSGNGNGAIPDGWYMTPSGKIMKKNSASAAAASPLRQPTTPFPGLSVLTMTMTMTMGLAVVIPTLLSGL